MARPRLEVKTCPKCNFTGNRSAFSYGNIVRDICGNCCKNKERVIRRKRADKTKAYAAEYRTRPGFKKKSNDRAKKETACKRKMILLHYSDGTLSCACCGEGQYEFLALDHKHGGGTAHRRELGRGGQRVYAWIIRNGFPEIFRVLCHNCNMAIGFYGTCPHQVTKDLLRLCEHRSTLTEQ